VAFGKDKNGKVVDYGSVVEAGTVLARIDDALYAADAAAAEAQLGQSKAALQRTEADLGQLKAKLFQAQRDWVRAQKLGPSDALSQADYDAAQSAYETAKANLEVGKAAITQAKKTVSQSEAALKRARQNLSYCTIVSPVKGVIIDRRDAVVRVPNQALRYIPGGVAAAASSRARPSAENAADQAQVWVLRDGKPALVRVATGLDDDNFTEIIAGDLKAGDTVIIAERQEQARNRSGVPRPRL
jgi:HlyD family secretion protein